MGELDNAAGLLMKTKSALVAALDEQKRYADDEARERVSLLAKFRNLEHECDGLKENLDEETVSKDNLARQLSKAQNESDMWRQKYEIDGIAKAEDLEMSKLKLQARLCDRIVGEWMQKVDSISMDLDVSQKETRNSSSELFKIKNAYEEVVIQLDEVRRENK